MASVDDENLMANRTIGSDIVEVELEAIKTIRKLEYKYLCSQHNLVGVSLFASSGISLSLQFSSRCGYLEKANGLGRVARTLLTDASRQASCHPMYLADSSSCSPPGTQYRLDHLGRTPRQEFE